MSCRVTFAAFVFLSSASCASDNPLAFSDIPFDPALAPELAAASERFAVMKGLRFEDASKGTSRAFTLHGSKVKIEALVENSRLQIAVFGPTTPQAIGVASANLGGQYICVANKARTDCPQCAAIALEDMDDECPPSVR